MKIDETKFLRKTRDVPGGGRADEVMGIEDRLGSILTDLASILISSGYGVSRVGRLVKRAYFDAAVELEAAAGHRANFARIAAITGLTRLEVSKLSRIGKRTSFSADSVPINRAHRVSWAWINDCDYCNSEGSPNILPFTGKKGSFDRLVKRYSGDIPARAMLSEMLRLKMVKEDAEKNIRLIRANTPVSRQTNTSLRALSPWTSFLAQIENRGLSELNANAISISLSFDSLPQLFAAVRELQTRASAFVESTKELSANRKRARRHKLDVTFVLGTRVCSAEETLTKKLRKSAS